MLFFLICFKVWMCFVFVLMFSCDLCKTMTNVYRVSKHASKKTSPTISAVLLECPKRSTPNCDRKMMVNIRVSPSDQVERVQKYLVLDEAFDQKRQVKAKLMSPYLIEITRGEPVLMYPLQFSKSIRCGSSLEDSKKEKEGSSASLQKQTKGLAELKGQRDSLQQGNKEDIVMVSDGNSGEAKDHLTDASFINIQDLLMKAGSNQNSLKGGSPGDVAHSGNIDSQPSETSDKDNSNVHKPPLVAKIHLGKLYSNGNTADKSKRRQIEDEKNQQLLQKLHNQGEKIKKDIIEAASKTSFTDVRKKRVGGTDKKSGKIKSCSCTNCDCKMDECIDNCQGSGPCIESCVKEHKSKISSKRMKQMRRYYQQRARAQSEDKKLVPENDLPIQELSDDSSNSDEPQQSREDEQAKDGNRKADGDGVEESASSGGSLTSNRIAALRYSKFPRFIQQDLLSRAEGNTGNFKSFKDIDSQDLWGVNSERKNNANFFRNGNQRTYLQGEDKSIRSNDDLNYQSTNLKCCDNCNCNSKCKCPQVGGISAQEGNNNDYMTPLQIRSLQTGGAELNTKGFQMPVSNSYQSSKVPFAASSNGATIDGDKKSNNFPVQRSPPEHNEKSFIQLHSGQNSGEDSEQAHLCPNKNCQLPHIPFGEENEIDNLKSHKTVPSSVDYPLHDNIASFGMGNEKGLESANELVGAPYEVKGESPQFLSYQDTNGAAGGGNELIAAEIDDKIYGSDSNFGTNSRNKLLYHDALNGNFDYNSMLTSRKISNSPGDDDLFMTAENGHDKLQLNQGQNHNFDSISTADVADQNIFRRSKEKAYNTEYDEDQEYASYPGGFGSNTPFGSGYIKPFQQPRVLEQAIKHSGGTPSGEFNCLLKNSPKAARETFYILPGEPMIGTLPSSKYHALESPLYQKKEFDHIIDDPNLNTFDKLDLLDNVIDPVVIPESRLENLGPEIDTGFIPYDISNIERIPFKIVNDGKTKRSYHLPKDASYDEYSGLFRGNPLKPFADDTSSCNCGSKKNDPCKAGTCNQKFSGDFDEGKRSVRSVSDVWYAVFNTSAPLQFLTTRIRIFRRRKNSWWRIAPSITLTSLSGIYANANLSILFSSHVEMFTLDKPLIIKDDHRVIFPKDQERSEKNILAVDNCKYNIDAMNPEDSKETQGLCEAAFHQLNPDLDSNNEKRLKRENEDDGIYAVGDLGYFPTNLNVLEQCPNDSSHLCLNILDTEAPAFGIKIQFPFRDNALVPPDYHQVRITSIVNDGTTNGALLVTVMAVNEALISHEYEISIESCILTCGKNNVVKRTLAPHVGEKVTFLLPMQESNPNSKFRCDVEVKSSKNKVIAKRQMTIQPLSRCLCIWHCSCYCISDLASNVVYDECQVLPESKERDAGFVEVSKSHFNWNLIFVISSFLLWLMLLLGLLKALLGCCIFVIDSWKYDYVQPMHRYEYASRCYRFFINSIFFLVLPFIFCCKCFTPTETDSPPSSDWGMSFVQQQLDSDDYGPPHSDDEETILSQHIEKETGRQRAGAEMDPSVTEYFCELYNDDEEDRDTSYVLNALAESRESLKMMDGHCSEEMNSADPRNEEAVELVRELVAGKIVYRTLNEPVGNANVPRGQSYSIRGYFLPAAGPGYQFITHMPLRQHWNICPDINTLRPIIPPIMLFSKEFTRNYTSKMDVLEAGDLSVRPSVNAPCINVLVQDISMYHQPDPDDLNEEP